MIRKGNVRFVLLCKDAASGAVLYLGVIITLMRCVAMTTSCAQGSLFHQLRATPHPISMDVKD